MPLLSFGSLRVLIVSNYGVYSTIKRGNELEIKRVLMNGLACVCIVLSAPAFAGECVFNASAGVYYYSAGVEMGITFLVVGWLLTTSLKEWAKEHPLIAVGALLGSPLLVSLMAGTVVSC
jgi:hypothetical protein